MFMQVLSDISNTTLDTNTLEKFVDDRKRFELSAFLQQSKTEI
jgi:hypothetical protein